jgi:hypothetical protein
VSGYCVRNNVFVVYSFGDEAARVVATYSPERIGFDTTGLPPRVLTAFEEAVSCHAAQCSAGAMMVRKTLEELCADQQIIGKTSGSSSRASQSRGSVLVMAARLRPLWDRTDSRYGEVVVKAARKLTP